MDEISQLLKESASAGNLVSIHTDPSDQSRASVGYVDKISNTEVRLKSISQDGQDSGYEIRNLKGIYRVDTNGKYEKKIELLYKNKDRIFKNVDLSDPIEGNSIISATLKEAKRKILVVILWTDDPNDSIIGLVENITPTSVKIMLLNSYGEEDGHVVVRIRNIIDMDCNTIEAQKLAFLNHIMTSEGRKRRTK